MPKTQVLKGATGFIVKHFDEYFRVPKAMTKNMDNAADVAEHLARNGTKLDDLTKMPSPRERLLGPTPGKLDETGQHVWRRMANDGQLLDETGQAVDLDDFGGQNGLRDLTDTDLDEIYVRGRDDQLYPLRETDMGHRDGAVDYWVREGHSKSPEENAAWMQNLDADPPGGNYEFQYRSDNRADGARNPHQYSDKDPGGPYAADIPGW